MSEISGIAAAMDAYFDGIHFGDTELLGTVLHPEIRLVCRRDGLTLDKQAYLATVGGRPSPAARGDERYDEVLSLSSATASTAHVRARLAYLPKVFTDELVFVREGGKWQIIAKVWDYTLQPETAAGETTAGGSQ
ncbi:MAG: nuclear transport factor 2 family protein [Acidimicrobiia bacterium]|nr:nuclear transport factor 2 family protein [Acidimicrobiia bacterium]